MKKGKIRKATSFLFSLIFAVVLIFSITWGVVAADPENGLKPCDFDMDTSAFQGATDATPTGDTYMIFDDWGGEWYDAEKTKDNTDDDLLCWAAAASNILQWTGWGLVVDDLDGDITNEDEIFAHFQHHWEDQGGLSHIGWQWWFSGTVPADYPNDPPYSGGPPEWAEVDVAGGGDFWTPPYNFADYVHSDMFGTNEMARIDEYLKAGYGVALGIYNGGHAITCWGFEYDPDVDPSDSENYYLGVYITDSDDDKESYSWDPPANRLRYYEVEYSGGHWYLQDYYGTYDWFIDYVFGLEQFPNTPPIADANGPYSADEGSSVTFDGSGSSDPDGNPLQYRWDFDNDGNWDTGWSSNPSATYAYPDDYNDVAVLKVSDYMASDTDTAAVTINNVAPVITVVGDTIDENGTATVSGTITDPSSLDTFTVVIDWGEGTPQSYSYPAGATTYSEMHQYLDDNPTGTPSDDYPISVTVTDDDGGVGTGSAIVTVDNVDPVVTGITMYQPNGQFILPAVHELDFTGTFTDVGTQDTHTAVWYWGDMSSSAGVVSESGGSGTVTGSHTYSAPGDYTITLTVTDDDTGYHSNTYLVHVADVDEALTITNNYIQGLDDSYFKGKADNRKAAIDNMFNALADMWTDGEYNGMIQDLRSNLREKADGYVDGKANNDWITDSAAQGEICQKIDDITAYLETLL
jgi:hypothetical protein